MNLPALTFICDISHEGYISGALIPLGSLNRIVVFMATHNSLEQQLAYLFTLGNPLWLPISSGSKLSFEQNQLT